MDSTTFRTWRATVRNAAQRGHLETRRGDLLAEALAGGVELARATKALDDAAASVSSESAALPVLPFAPDGLRAVCRLAGWALRWNKTARGPECRYEGVIDAAGPPSGGWQEATGLTLDRLMTDLDKAATTADGRSWAGRSARIEGRVLRVAAALSGEVEGEGSAVYEAVRDHLASLGGAGTVTLSGVLDAAGCFQKYESASRAPKTVYADGKQALKDGGWGLKSVRIGGQSRQRWIGPNGPGRRAPLRAILGGKASKKGEKGGKGA